MMNIVHIDGVIAGLAKAKEANKIMASYHKYDILLLKENEVLSKLTGNLAPEMFLQEMMVASDLDIPSKILKLRNLLSASKVLAYSFICMPASLLLKNEPNTILL